MFVVVVDAQVWTIRVLLRTVCRFCGARLRVPGFSTVTSMPGKLINKREPLTRATGANPLTFCCCYDPQGSGVFYGLFEVCAPVYEPRRGQPGLVTVPSTSGVLPSKRELLGGATRAT